MSWSVISLSLDAKTWSAPWRIIDSISSLPSLVFWSTRRPATWTQHNDLSNRLTTLTQPSVFSTGSKQIDRYSYSYSTNKSKESLGASVAKKMCLQRLSKRVERKSRPSKPGWNHACDMHVISCCDLLCVVGRPCCVGIITLVIVCLRPKGG